VFLRLLERWPSAQALAASSRDEIEAFARSCRHGWPARFAGRATGALAAPQLSARPELARAKAGAIRLAAAQLLLLRAQRRAWESRRASCCPARPAPGGTRPRRTRTRGRRSRAARST